MAHGPVKRAEATVFGAKVRVIDIAIDDVGNHAFRVQLAADRIRRRADADQIVGMQEVESFLAGDHGRKTILPMAASAGVTPQARASLSFEWWSARSQPLPFEPFLR